MREREREEKKCRLLRQARAKIVLSIFLSCAASMEPAATPSQDLIERIASGEFRRIVILSGAGVSTASGIPDYRSLRGQFAMFSDKIFSDRAAFNASKAKREGLFEGKGPTESHRLAVFLHQRGLLRRVYTQNIDGLYQAAGLAEEMLVEAHGNMKKDTIVLYGETLPYRFEDMAVIDFLRCKEPPDLLLVMGSTLQVAPFCALANFVPRLCARALITLNIQEAMKNNYNKLPGPQFVKFAKHRVTLKGKWGLAWRRRWPRQYLLDEDVDAWSKRLVAALSNAPPKQPTVP